ncbi:actin patch protein 1, partial [Tothia fuscella]
PLPPGRNAPRSQVSATLLRYLFPNTRNRARVHLTKFRNDYLPGLKHRTQSRIYRFLVRRQSRRQLRKKPSILGLLRHWSQDIFGNKATTIKDVAAGKSSQITQTFFPSSTSKISSSKSVDMADDGASGSKRTRFKGYLKAANELRQTYQQQYASGWSQRESWIDEPDDGTSGGGYGDAAVVRSGHEEMILFPSYARKHVKVKPRAQSGTIQQQPGEGRDVRDGPGEGDAEVWKQKWDEYEDDDAIVDVDVRGWVFAPHKGQLSRKQRIFISLARQLAGLPAPPSPPSGSPSGSRSSSPHPHRDRLDNETQRHEQELAAKEANKIINQGQAKAEAAGRGEYSESTSKDSDRAGLGQRQGSQDTIHSKGSVSPDLRRVAANNAAANDDDPKITPLQKRQSWNHPSAMSAKEIAMANEHLMARLKPFISNPLSETPISAFFYNDKVSRQRTVHTNDHGHFALRAALDFIPTHVRILASEHLSATEEVIVTDPNGVSLISDIDDTIKHSAIGSGAREIFRNAFIRDLNDLTIEGVQQWYGALAKRGVKFHYVSNSPWQLYPVITKFFAEAGLPPGSFHLKQYSGMLQGIFEPVAERKKSTLDRIAGDFPERRFILVGDSGEADLEVYLDFVQENPGRVLGIFIRDVTTSVNASGFFDSSTGPMTGQQRQGSTSQSNNGSLAKSESQTSEKEEADLQAAIKASLKDADEEDRRSRPSLPARRSAATSQAPKEEKLIDLSDDEPTQDSGETSRPTSNRKASSASTRSIPPVPRKPASLRTTSGQQGESEPAKKKAPAPPPSRRLKPNSPTTSDHPPPIPRNSKPNTTNEQSGYIDSAKQTLASAYSHLPAIRSTGGDQPTSSPQRPPFNSTASHDVADTSTSRNRILPPPPRRTITAYPAAAASYTSNRVSNAWYGTQQPTREQRFSTSSASGQNLPVNKKVDMWNQRWTRAQQVLKEKGVTLKSWRVGSDVLEESIKLVEKAEKEDKKGRPQG